MALYEETTELLTRAREMGISRTTIATRAGLGIDWLQKLAQGAIRDPGARRTERLRDTLKTLIGERNVQLDPTETRGTDGE